MLTHIAIRDFAIIDELELELGRGMTVLTGETGAGKSILVDALGLVLGDRADAGAVRHGAERAEVSAEFDLDDAPVANDWLQAQDLGADGECILRRILGRDGRSRAQINGRSVPMQLLKELGEQLVDIHGQHEHQSLLRRDTQMHLLDAHGQHESLLAEVARLHKDWKTTHEQLSSLRTAAVDRDARLEMLRYQVNELHALKLQPDESVSLDEEHKRLANGGRLMEGAQSALDLLYEDENGSAYQLLMRAVRELEKLAELDPRLSGVREILAGTEAQLSEAGDALRHYLADTDLDPRRLQWLEDRLGVLHELARKHRIDPQQLLPQLQNLSAELKQLENADIALQELEALLDSVRGAYRHAADALHDKRVKTAAELGRKVTAVMQELGMPGGKFAVEVTIADAERFTSSGIDSIEFMVSANRGQPPRPLAKVASGGELSRISLAIQVIAAQAATIPSMVFDEVDAGIGGGVAEIVGRRLRTLGQTRQVLCVTHLPQVASQAHQHLRVSKQTQARATLTRIETLDRKLQIEELARMLGGIEITETTRKHAREMLARAEQET
ncbi:MAG TPA: DNA repair protein RecN [Gammaproteobacteria bacterium]|nr:DNA repair protein RecN [Gammaproteobacteria bacterium]